MSKPISKAKARLTTKVTASSTTISFTGTDTNRSLESVTMSDFGTYGYLTINPTGNINNYEIVRFTSWSVSGDIITVGGLTRNLTLQGSDSGGTGLEFAAGTNCIVSTNHHWFNRVVLDEGAQTIAGVKTFSSSPIVPTPSGNTDAANKAYVDGVAVAGASDANTTTKGIIEIATDAENVAGTATGGTGAILVPRSSALATTPTGSKIPMGTTNGVIDQGWVDIVGIAGEAIDASTTPKAVYLKESDGKWYRTNSTSAGEAVYRYRGFVANSQNVSGDATVMVRVRGSVSGFTGLTAGADYFLTNTAGAISTTPGSVKFRACRAISTTSILIDPSVPTANGTFQATTSETKTITVGFRPIKITFFSVYEAATPGNGASSYGAWVEGGSDKSMRITGASPHAGGLANYVIHISEGVNSITGSVSNVTSTTFDVVITETGTVGDCDVVWIAEGN